MATELRLPEVGENIATAHVVRVRVAPGDPVTKDQTVIEIETDKATLEVPAGAAGTVKELRVKEGTDVKVGEVILTIEEGEASATPPAAEEEAKAAPAAPPKQEAAPAPASEPVKAPASSSGAPVAAAPSVRRLAREMGIDISQVTGTGPGGRISAADLQAFAGGGTAPVAGRAPMALPDFSKQGPVEIEPMSTIRRVIAERLSYSWATVPHVHHNDQADVTDLTRMVEQYNERRAQGTPKLTVTAVILKALAAMLGRHPMLNASVDMEGRRIIRKQFINIGVAVDTARGLLVPVIRDANKKSILALATELDELARKGREGKLTPDEMSGGTFTLTNLGGIGGTSFNPIINWPEVAILGVSRSRAEGERLLMPMCLGYDHRVIDGAEGARAMADLARMLSNPLDMLLEL